MTFQFEDNTYEIEELGKLGLMGILAAVNKHGGVISEQNPPNFSELDLEKAMSWTRPYGSKIDDISECALLKDGSFFMCWTVSTWGGTFASHDDIEVEYYLLRKI